MHQLNVVALFCSEYQDASCCLLLEVIDICNKEATMAEFDTEGSVIFMVWFFVR